MQLTITITMPSVETGAGATTSGGIRVQHYYPVGPAQQLGAYGWGIGQWSGTVSGEVTNTLNGALLNDAYGTGGSGTSITLTGCICFSFFRNVLYSSGLRRNFLYRNYRK